MKPTKTTNPIHFEDLDSLRFEDLSKDIVYRLKKWKNIKHYGRTGKDGGIDLIGIDENDHKWAIQCKRYSSITKNQLKGIIDIIVEKHEIPDTLLLVISCNLSKTKDDYFVRYAQTKGINNVLIWTSSIIESKLYNDYKDLLFTYFNIEPDKIYSATIENIEYKKKLRDTFKSELYRPSNPREPLIGVDRFNDSKIIIRDINSVNSKQNTQNEHGWYSYFAAEPYRLTDEGFDLIIGLYNGYIDENNMFVRDKDKADKFFEHAIVPYSNILNYDFHNDQCRPILYCTYKGRLGPFSEIYFKQLDK